MFGKGDVLSYQKQWAIKAEKAPDYESYLSTLEANLCNNLLTNEARIEFESADGSELIDKKYPAKMKALHSSSALAYNVFEHWRYKRKSFLCNALGLRNKIENLRFEKKLDTGISTPNIDVYIKLEDGTSVSIESKFCEWMDKKKSRFKKRYFIENGKKINRWLDEGLPNSQNLAEQIQNGLITFERLDAPQLLKHALGIAKTEIKNSRLYYIYYDLSENSKIRSEHEGEINKFLDALGGELGFRAMSYQYLFKAFKGHEFKVENFYLEYLEHRYFPNVT